MFTGIITDLGEVIEIDGTGLYRIRTTLDLSAPQFHQGASIAHDGVCLTLLDKKDDTYTVHASPETLRVTTMQNWKVGHKVNLEAALKAGDALGGHMVSGHVDTIGSIANITPEGENNHLTFTAPHTLMPMIAPKGSITVNGISLTVNTVKDDTFTVNIIPHTWQVTNLALVGEGNPVNLEIDTMARYLDTLLKARGIV